MHDYPITRYMGFAIIILAILEIFNVTNFKPILLLGFSISALFLTFVDFIEIKADEKEDPFKYRTLKLVVLFSAICFFIIIPNLSISVSDELLSKLNNIVVLLSIGLLFVIIGYKQEKIVNDKFIDVVNGLMNDVLEKALEKELEKHAERITEEMFEERNLSKTIREAMNKIDREEGRF